ncbi:hypothetical protein D3C85_270730 [compost metagenome]
MAYLVTGAASCALVAMRRARLTAINDGCKENLKDAHPGLFPWQSIASTSRV